MPQTNRALSLVDVLAAGPARTKRIDLAFAQQVVVRFRQKDHGRPAFGSADYTDCAERENQHLHQSVVCFARSGVEAYNLDMLKSRYIRAATVAFAFAALLLSSGAAPQRTAAYLNQQPVSIIAQENLLPDAFVNDRALPLEPTAASPDPLSSTSTFYTVRADLRRCIAPMCGGYFVKRVNLPLTRCPNGRSLPECYVAEIDWNGQPQVDAGLALLRGSMMAKTYGRFGNLGVLRVTESWQAVSNSRPTGTFYRVRDRGVRCITFPCPTHHEAKLNSTLSRDIAGVDVVRVGVVGSMNSPEGVIVAGDHVPVTGPGGKSVQLKATQIYLRMPNSVSTMKPCMKTGCSGAVCSDHDVITTCEWRPEYACYQKATCERQPDGNCGFTRTRELTSCLAAAR